jgi:hypothetical protein
MEYHTPFQSASHPQNGLMFYFLRGDNEERDKNMREIDIRNNLISMGTKGRNKDRRVCPRRGDKNKKKWTKKRSWKIGT